MTSHLPMYLSHVMLTEKDLLIPNRNLSTLVERGMSFKLIDHVLVGCWKVRTVVILMGIAMLYVCMNYLLVNCTFNLVLRVGKLKFWLLMD